MGIFPLWWSSFSEQFGRRTIYLISFALFFLFSILSAISSSVGMFIAMRLLNGGAAASVQAVGAGTIADIWEPRERGKAVAIFYMGPLCGPLLAPIIGGLLTEGLGWRSTLWFTTIYGGKLRTSIDFGSFQLTTARSHTDISYLRATRDLPSQTKGIGPYRDGS